MFYYFDWTYLLIVGPALLLSLWASAKVKSTFSKYNKIPSKKGISGAEAAEALLRANGITDVKLAAIGDSLGDNYDPRTKVANLSVYNNRSIAGIGVACHEIGHAIQHNKAYFPLQIRNAIVPITNFGAKVSMPLIVIGILMSYVSMAYYNLIYGGIICFGLCVLFQLITLPVEFNASNRAIRGISELGILDEDELKGAKKVLQAAALTYVAALAVSMAQLLRLLLIFGGGRRD